MYALLPNLLEVVVPQSTEDSQLLMRLWSQNDILESRT